MDAEMKAKWVTGLRSGTYVQGTGDLRKDGSFCCLGVLCDVAGATWQDFEFEENWGSCFYRDVLVLGGECLSDGENGELGKSGMARFGLADDHQRTLINMNDGAGGCAQHSFEQIAAYIEDRL